MAKSWAFVRLSRPVFLLGPMALYALGAAIARRQGIPLDAGGYVIGQVFVTATQLMTHYANEFFDLESDRVNAEHRTFFSGGSGVLVRGELSPVAAWHGARVCAVTAVVALTLIAWTTPVAGLAGVVMLAGAWFYSAPPVTLMGSGWGEAVASLIVAVLVPFLGFWMQGAGMPPVLWAVTAPLFLLHMAMLMAFEFADFEADHSTGKRTLAVRLGRHRALWAHHGFVGCAGVVLLMVSMAGPWTAHGRFAWVMIPAGVIHVVNVSRVVKAGSGPYTTVTWGAVILFALTAGLWLVGFVV